MRGNGPTIAWFKDPAGNILSVVEETMCSAFGRQLCCKKTGTTFASLKVRAHVLPHLVMPVRPVVAAFRAPVVQVMSDAAIPQHLGHSIGGAAVLPWTR